LLRDENEQIAENFLAAHPDFKLLNAAEILKQQQINLDTGDYLKLLPHLHNTDGFFAAVFEKTDGISKPAKVVAEVEAVVETVTTEPKAKKAAAKPKVAKPKVVKEAAVEETLVEEIAAEEAVVKEKVAKPKVVKEKAIKEKVVKEKVAKPKAVKTKAVKE
jgi:16S rRNA (cytosine967-C5)-methyltransferase